jgi:ribosomal protein S18 acetylase RimI-like enzyme
MALKVKEILYKSADYKAACALRERTLRQPIGLVLRAEDVAHDLNRKHLGAYDGEVLIGCVSLVLEPSALRIKQMAVDSHYQRYGVGSALVRAAEAAAAKYGYSKVVMSARVSAQSFYEKQGYHVTSGEFEDVQLPHVEMEKAIS